jgi:hypothetical protein
MKNSKTIRLGLLATLSLFSACSIQMGSDAYKTKQASLNVAAANKVLNEHTDLSQITSAPRQKAQIFPFQAANNTSFTEVKYQPLHWQTPPVAETHKEVDYVKIKPNSKNADEAIKPYGGSKKPNVLAIFSLIFGLLLLIPGALFLVLPGMVALTTGAVALRQIRKYPGYYGNKWMAIIGIIAGSIAAAFALFLAIAAAFWGASSVGLVIAIAVLANISICAAIIQVR